MLVVQHAPPSIRSLPHGVLVELVQLLLNQKILLFRKGKVSVSPNLPYADLQALAALSVASKPHTALLSTTKGPQGQQAAAQLRILYQQLQGDIDAYNRAKLASTASLAAPVSSPEDEAQVTDSLSVTSRARSSSAPVSPPPPSAETDWAELGADTDSMLPADALGSSVDVDDMQFQMPTPGQFHAALISPRREQMASLPRRQSLPLPLAPMPAPANAHIAARPQTANRPQSASERGSGVESLAQKLLQSKWGPLALPLLSTGQQFPFAPIWHYDLSSQSLSTCAACLSAPCFH